MLKFKTYIPSILVLLYTSTLYMTYFINDVVQFQIIIYSMVLLCYALSKKVQICQSKYMYVLLCVLTSWYFIRTFVDIELLNAKQELYGNDSSVFFFMLNGLVLPSVMIPRMQRARSYKITFLIIGVFLTYSLYVTYSNFMQGIVLLTQDNRVMANDRLSVIEYGHLGLTTVIVAIYFIVECKRQKILLALSGVMLFLGIVSMFLAGTRSAMIASFVIAAIYLFAKGKINYLFILIAVFAPFYLYADVIASFLDGFGINSANRIFALFEENGDQSSGRTILWEKAFVEISDNLLCGVSSFFKYGDIKYVHNSIIEITYALGIFGGIVFIFLNYKAFRICIEVFRSGDSGKICFSLLYIQYFVYSMFSESIIRLSLFWIFLAYVISFKVQKNENSISYNSYL